MISDYKSEIIDNDFESLGDDRNQEANRGDLGATFFVQQLEERIQRDQANPVEEISDQDSESREEEEDKQEDEE